MSESTTTLWSEFSLANERNPAQKHRWRMMVAEARRCVAGIGSPRIVDFGCGSGALLERIAATIPGAVLAGVDAEPLALEIAARRLPQASFRQADLETGDCEPGAADVILCSEVLEHLAQPAHAVAMAARALRPGGFIIVTVPSGSMTAFDQLIGHRRHYALADLEDLLTANGFRVLRAWRWGFPFHTLFRIAMRLAPNAAMGFGDRGLSAPKRAALDVLDVLFRLNVRSRRVGRQLVAVAQRTA